MNISVFFEYLTVLQKITKIKLNLQSTPGLLRTTSIINLPDNKKRSLSAFLQQINFINLMSFSFDTILDERIGFGKAQIKQFSILSFVDFMDGFSIIFLSILITQLKHQWELNLYEVIALTSTFYFGIAFGKLLQGYLSDRIGRALLLMITMFAMLLTLMAHLIIAKVWNVVILRLLYGIEFGISIPLAQVLLCEQTPSEYRGRLVCLLQFSYILGIVYLLLISQVYLTNFEEGNWKGLVMFNLVPTTICCLGCVFILRESPRLYLIKKQFCNAFERIYELGHENKGSNFQILTKNEKDILINQSLEALRNPKGKSVSDLFKDGRTQITLTLWAIMMIWSMQSQGTLILFPFIFQKSNLGFNAMLLAHCGEFIAVIFGFLMIDSVSVGGRKGTLYFTITVYMITQFTLHVYREPAVQVCTTILRFADRLTWICVHQAKMECYTTYYRTFGLGIAQFLGFTAAGLAPILVFPLYFEDPFLPFLVMGFFSCLLLISVCLHPVNLTKRMLDDNTQM